MTPQEIQRMMDFILRSQADAVIRMDQWEGRRGKWEERMEGRMERLHDEIDRLHDEVDRVTHAVQEATNLSTGAIREARTALQTTTKQTKRFQRVEKSTRAAERRSDSMGDLMKIALRLLAHQSKRLDALEQGRL